MDPKQNAKGAAAQAASDALGPQPPMVKAKVRPGANYSTGNRATGERKQHRPGDIVEVTAAEYRASKHSLVTVEDERAEASAADEAAKPPDHTALFRAFRHRARAAQAQKVDAARERRRQELIDLGFAPMPQAPVKG